MDMVPFGISVENYIRFMKNHSFAKKHADNFEIALNGIENAIHYSRGVFIEIHNYKALCCIHGREVDQYLLQDYYKQKKILRKENKLGIDEVIPDLYKIYERIIDGNIKNKTKLREFYDAWHKKHENSIIGDFNIPQFDIILDLKKEQIELIYELNRLLTKESRYKNTIFEGDTII